MYSERLPYWQTWNVPALFLQMSAVYSKQFLKSKSNRYRSDSLNLGIEFMKTCSSTMMRIWIKRSTMYSTYRTSAASTLRSYKELFTFSINRFMNKECLYYWVKWRIDKSWSYGRVLCRSEWSEGIQTLAKSEAFGSIHLKKEHASQSLIVSITQRPL